MDSIIWAHIVVAFSVVLPVGLMQFVDLEKPSDFLGYRTPASVRSPEAWKYANQMSKKLILWGSGITLTVQLFTAFTLNQVTSILITCGVLTVLYIAVLIVVEMQLRKRFDKEGKPKSGYARFD